MCKKNDLLNQHITLPNFLLDTKEDSFIEYPSIQEIKPIQKETLLNVFKKLKQLERFREKFKFIREEHFFTCIFSAWGLWFC